MSTRRPHIRDLVLLDGRTYRIAAEAIAPVPGFWLGREDGPVVCERFIPRTAWDFAWDGLAQRWLPHSTTETTESSKRLAS